MNRADLQQLADARVQDAEALLNAGRWPAAYYLLGYAIECALKACAARQFREHEVPDKTIVNHFYTHKLDLLLNISGVKMLWNIGQRQTRRSESTGTRSVTGARHRAMILLPPKPKLGTCIQPSRTVVLECCHG